MKKKFMALSMLMFASSSYYGMPSGGAGAPKPPTGAKATGQPQVQARGTSSTHQRLKQTSKRDLELHPLSQAATGEIASSTTPSINKQTSKLDLKLTLDEPSSPEKTSNENEEQRIKAARKKLAQERESARQTPLQIFNQQLHRIPSSTYKNIKSLGKPEGRKDFIDHVSLMLSNAGKSVPSPASFNDFFKSIKASMSMEKFTQAFHKLIGKKTEGKAQQKQSTNVVEKPFDEGGGSVDVSTRQPLSAENSVATVVEGSSAVTQVEPVVAKSASTKQPVGVAIAQSSTGQVADMSKSPDFKALQDQVKTKFSNLSEDDVNKITQLVQVIKSENVSKVPDLWKNDKYQKLRETLYGKGDLPGDGAITSADLVQLSSGQSAPSAQRTALSDIARGVQLASTASGGVKKPANPLIDQLKQGRKKMNQSSKESFLFTNAYSQQFALEKWVSKVRDALIDDIRKKAQGAFKEKSSILREELKAKYNAKASQPDFNKKISEMINIKQENAVQKALSEAADQIAVAVQQAQREFADKVSQATKEYESSHSKQTPSDSPVKVLKFADRMKKSREEVAVRQAEATVKTAIADKVEKDVLEQKSSWQDEYEYDYPGLNPEVAWKKFVASKVEEAYRQQDNMQAIQRAKDSAVLAQQSASPVSVAQSSISETRNVVDVALPA